MNGLNRDLNQRIMRFCFVSGSAPLSAETHIQFEQRTGHRILNDTAMQKPT